MSTPRYEIYKKLGSGHSIDLLFLVNLAIFPLVGTAKHLGIPNDVAVK
jgi:hypothetical protein